MSICKYCEIDKEFGGEDFRLDKLTNIDRDGYFFGDVLIASFLRLSKIDGKPSIESTLPYETKDGDIKFGIASREINYCPFCGRNLTCDSRKAAERVKAHRMMRKTLNEALKGVEEED